MRALEKEQLQDMNNKFNSLMKAYVNLRRKPVCQGKTSEIEQSLEKINKKMNTLMNRSAT